jgi:uncharacterized protein (DUF1800 family)
MAVLTRYTGLWSRKQVVFLLKRTMFGAKPADVDYFYGKGMAASVDELLVMPAAPAPPVNYYEDMVIDGSPYHDVGSVPLGATWVNSTYGDGTTNFLRGESLRSWWIGNMAMQGRSIQEKMVLFWHSHFCTEIRSGTGAVPAYRLVELFRTYALGQLRPLVVEVTKNPCMTFYLNGYLNTKYSPDENYSRELQELFTVGKGPDSKYTEDDVREAARVLTGHSIDWDSQVYTFRDTLHDTGSKTFSAFYGNKVISGQGGPAGANELDDLVDMLLGTDECAKHVIRRIYRFFVNYDITPAVEADIITPLATLYRSNAYNMKPVMEELLKSDHFFQAIHMGAMIKSPLDFVIGLARECDVKMPPVSTDVFLHYRELRYNLYEAANNMQQALGDPPNVSGWPSYYQTPQYYELWINSDTLPKRNKYAKSMLNFGFYSPINHIRFAEQFTDVADPGTFLEDVITTLYMLDLSQATKDKIKTDTLLSGQSQEHYWTDAWNDYKNDPSDTAKSGVVTVRLKAMMELLMQSSEYQLC